MALTLPPVVDTWVRLQLPDVPGTPDGIEGAGRTARAAAAAAPRIIEGLEALVRTRPDELGPLLMEVLDVFSHRLDAWITSLAAKRLAASPPGEGVRIGGYGWVEDLRPSRETPVTTNLPGVGEVSVSLADGYIHAPSLHHAATAAVLRSGFLAHAGDATLAVDLTSRRARVARWLLRGVRNGQNLGTLLGYRFERALHDAGLDDRIPRFRRRFPAPAAPEPPPLDGDAPSDLWARSREAIADRNVVDGLALARAVTSGGLGDEGEVAPHLGDLVDALDAVGDLVLAESVHHLIGGNALRAGMAADTLGQGRDVPDRFEVLTTPHRGRAITQRLAVALPDVPAPAPGWPADDLTALEPRLDAWVSGLLGPATELRLSGTVTETGEEFTQTADQLGMGALALILDASSADQPRLTRKGTRRLHGEGWAGLRELAVRLRTLLASAQPLAPAHLLPPDAAPVPVDLGELRDRVTAYRDAVVAAGGDPERLAALGVTAADPAAAAARLGTVLAGTPGEDWLRMVTDALSALLGARLPLAPRLTGVAIGPRPAGATGSAIGAWLGRYATVRPAARAWHETLLLTGGAADHTAAQEPMRTAADPWIGGTFDPDDRPPAQWHLACHLPEPIGAGEPLAGIVLDEWTETLPGSDGAIGGAGTRPHELTGVAFPFDRPDAKAPQAVLLAVPPDPERGWTADVLALAVHDTLELAKMRAVDLGDLPLLDNLLPGVTAVFLGTLNRVLAKFEEDSGIRLFDPFTGEARFPPDDMYRMEPLHRSSEVASGLAARTHDAAWLLTRQWQFGEFAGQDAGSPIDVELTGQSRPITSWRPPDGPWTPYDPRLGPLEPQVESEPPVADDRARAEGGAQFAAMLAEAGLSDALPPLLAEFGLRPASGGGLVGLLGGRVPDAVALAEAIDAGRLTGDGPGDGLADVARRWRDWWAEAVPPPTPDTFDGHRFEHRLALAAGDTLLTADEYLGDGLDWYSLDAEPGAIDPEAGSPLPLHAKALPAPVRYGGIPADRFWEMEDAAVDLGSVAVDALDTGRLLLIGFATTYGNDWFTLPLEVPAGSLTTLTSILVTDTFGERYLVERAGLNDPSWNMFALHGAPDGLLMMPTAADMPGRPLETLVLARDELANVGWAIERTVTDGRGELLDRREEWLRIAPAPPAPAGPSYAVQTIVPDYWLPLVPEAVGAGAIRFKLVGLLQPGVDSAPRGRLLTGETWLHEEEVPREGSHVTRRPVLSRWTDGSWHAWIRREKTAGTGESSSGLAFDIVRPSEAWPI
ncbi:hypothetical protein ACH35V_03535 [Actinomadura sp. 1N219]|uniref:hypothetical protein n=1 Tax=Actinomadura sp. 1N219 TaxID=3375152 RepID=UPI0037A38477